MKLDVGSPDKTTALITEDGPGMWLKLILWFMHSCIRWYPGSDIAGVPASLIIAMSKFGFLISFLIIRFVILFSLCSCRDKHFDRQSMKFCYFESTLQTNIELF